MREPKQFQEIRRKPHARGLKRREIPTKTPLVQKSCYQETKNGHAENDVKSNWVAKTMPQNITVASHVHSYPSQNTLGVKMLWLRILKKAILKKM